LEKTRPISSKYPKFLRKSANSVADTVQIFGQFPAGKIGRCEITVDLDVIEVRGGRTAATIPGVWPTLAAGCELPGIDGECQRFDRQILDPTF
jgi:hypothetical protein